MIYLFWIVSVVCVTIFMIETMGFVSVTIRREMELDHEFRMKNKNKKADYKEMKL